MSTWEIVNPSDPYTMDAADHDVAAAVVIFLGQGRYAAQEVNGDRFVPLMLFGVDDAWSTATFGCNVADLLARTVETKRDAVVAAFESVVIASAHERAMFDEGMRLIDDPAKREQWRTTWNERRRSSMNNIGKRAQQLADTFRVARTHRRRVMDAQAELDRLASALGRALGSTATARVRPFGGDLRYVFAGDPDRNIETGACATDDEAVAELRAILRADTDGAVADVLDELAAEMERGPITAEMLRTMAAARRGA